MCVSVCTDSLSANLYKKALCPSRLQYATTGPSFLYRTSYVESFKLYPQCLDSIFWNFKLEKIMKMQYLFLKIYDSSPKKMVTICCEKTTRKGKAPKIHLLLTFTPQEQ